MIKKDVGRSISSVCLLILTVIAVTVGLIYTRNILVPFVIALFWYALLTPILKWLQKAWRLPRILALLVTAVFFLAVSALLFYLVTLSLQRFIQGADLYKQQIAASFTWISETSRTLGLPIKVNFLERGLEGLPILKWIQNLTSELVAMVGSTALVIIFVLFLMTGEAKERTDHPLLTQIINQTSRYIAAKFFISLLTGLIVAGILILADSELIFMFSVLTVLLNFIPNIGSIVATLLPGPVILLQYGFTWPFFVVLIALALVQFIIGNILEPKIMGESLDLHPVTILLFLMFWGLVWGIAGMFLAVPITAVLKIILSRIESTKVLAELLAGRLPA